MRKLPLFAVLVCLALPLAGQQIPTIRVVAAPGKIENGRFFNRTLGVQYTFPAGWAAHVPAFPPDPAKGIQLLNAAPAAGAARERVLLYAVPLAKLPEKLREPRAFLLSHPLAERGPADVERERTQLAATPLEVASRAFVRMDWRLSEEDDEPPPDAFETQFAGAVNGQMLVLFLRAPTAEAIERLAETASTLRFYPPQPEEDADDEETDRAAVAEARPAKRVEVPELALRVRLRDKVEPVYPPEALNRNVQGDVMVRVLVGADGRVREATALTGHPLLTDAALDAVRQWIFEPFTAEGAPVEVESTLRVSFRLKSARQAS